MSESKQIFILNCTGKQISDKMKGNIQSILRCWDGFSDVLSCYWRAWEIAFGNLRKPVPGSGFVSPYIGAAFNGCIFMWDSAFMMLFGIKADVSSRKIRWEINLLERHSVETYPFGQDGSLPLICAARKNAMEKPELSIISNVDFDLEIIWGTAGNRNHQILNVSKHF